MKSLLYQSGSPYEGREICQLQPCRQEVKINLRKDGRIYSFIARDKVMPEDPYLVMVRAAAFAIQTGEAYAGTPPARSLRDFLIKQNSII